MALEVKEVIQLAKRQFVELLPDLELASPSNPPSKSKVGEETKKIVDIAPEQHTKVVRLEELEREGKNWAVTLSVPNPEYNSKSVLEGIIAGRNLARIAKVIVIDGEQGNLLAVRKRAA